jgi:tRNA dimethylallyltransferase
MSAQTDKLPITVLIGATGVGKTAFSLNLAEQLDAEIVAADSRTIYRGMDIGTAKATKTEQQRVRHHLIDVADPDETWSLALYQQKSHEAIHEILSRGKNVLIVGGTGQYIRALLQGWSPPKLQPHPQLRSVLEQIGHERGKLALYQELEGIDPQAAEAIEWQNLRRTIRALEVILTTGEKFSAQRSRVESPYDAHVIGLTRNREELYQRIDLRIDQMISDGLVEEVQTLLNKGYSPEIPSMSAIGYREICEYLTGKITLGEAVAAIRKNTRTYVRRQANWFKPTDPTIHWYDISGNQDYNLPTDFIKDRKPN